METPETGPKGPRGPKTTSPEGEPLKKQEPKRGSGESSGHEEGSRTVERDNPPEPSRPHGDPLREQLPR